MRNSDMYPPVETFVPIDVNEHVACEIPVQVMFI